MTIKSKLTKQGFIYVCFVLAYNKNANRIATAFIACGLLLMIVDALISKQGSFVPILVPLFMLSITPLQIYLGAAKNFNASQRINETIEYQFEPEYLAVKGESFSSQMSWDKIYKVTQTKNWLLIWQNKAVGNPIAKDDITQEQIAALKQILESHQVKNNL